MEWSTIIAAFERSDETHAEFCERNRVKLSSFRTWLYRLRAARRPSASVVLLPVDVTATPAAETARRAEAPVVVRVANVEVRVVAGTDPEYVAALVVALGARC